MGYQRVKYFKSLTEFDEWYDVNFGKIEIVCMTEYHSELIVIYKYI